VGSTLKDANFRAKFHAGALGVHRENYRAPFPCADSMLKAGDVLLLGAPGDWGEHNATNANFASIIKVPGSSPPKKNRGLLSIFLGLTLVIVQVCSVMSLGSIVWNAVIFSVAVWLAYCLLLIRNTVISSLRLSAL
jgi:hypothetical protein